MSGLTVKEEARRAIAAASVGVLAATVVILYFTFVFAWPGQPDWTLGIQVVLFTAPFAAFIGALVTWPGHLS